MKRCRATRSPWPFLLLSLLAHAATGEAQEPGGQMTDRVKLLTSETQSFGSVALSPDGRWLAFTVSESTASSTIWTRPVAGGEAVRITEIGFWDDRITWFPSGDRLLFLSNRPARAGDTHVYAMAVPIDRRTGRAAGPPRQVTADPVASSTPKVSADGKHILYVDGSDARVLKVAPSVGGTSRVVARIGTGVRNVAFSSDGEHALMTTILEWPVSQAILRVPLSGGEPREIGRVDSPIWASSNDGRRFVRWFNGPGRDERTLEVITPEGKPVHRFAVNRRTMPGAFTPDGRGVLVYEGNAVAPTRLMPVAGGATRDLTPGNAYDWVLGFSGDGSAVLTWTEEAGRTVVARVPLEGGRPEVWPETDTTEWEGAYGRYLLSQTRPSGDAPRRMVAVDLDSGQRHLVSDALPAQGQTGIPGPGGNPWTGTAEIYFFEQRGEHLDVRAWGGPDRSRRVRSFPAGLLNRGSMAVHGDRVVWQETRGDSSVILVAEGAGAARTLLSFPRTSTAANEIAISHDGAQAALHYSRGPDSPDLMALVDLTGGKEPRVIDTGWTYWYWPRWLPDGSGVLAVAGGAGAEAHVGLVSAREGGQATILTRADPAPKWGFEVSPDGRYIAYPAEVWKGSTIWRLDLPTSHRPPGD